MALKQIVRVVVAVFVLGVIFANNIACNTTKGLGKDTEKAGEGIQHAADKNGAD